jgi:hypothetical protein
VTRGTREVEKAVSRTLRETLNALQRTAEELNQALSDLVAACGSSRPTNALSPILRAHTAAASLAASLEVLSRFVATSSSSPAADLEQEASPPPAAVAGSAAKPSAAVAPQGSPIEQLAASPQAGGDEVLEIDEDLSAVQQPAVKELAIADVDPRIDSPPAQTLRPPPGKRATSFAEISPNPAGPAANPIEELPAAAASFDISTLLPEEQDLHRRANRVAKVCMQDIKMLHPSEVRLGREHKDICLRLRDDIEKAHKEYDRRFQSILGHPVDYFYDWMVEILGEGNPEALGEYPYPSPIVRR